MTVVPFPDRGPWRLRCLMVELAVELELARRARPVLAAVRSWQCTNCGAWNQDSAVRCRDCGV